jgi:hypothetical protein
MDVRKLPEHGSATLNKATKATLVPLDNPFFASADANERLVYVYGLRNPFRFHIDNSSGDLLIADVGLLDFEEVNYAAFPSDAGANFGWPFFEGPAPRSETGCQRDTAAQFVAPISYYDRTGHQASIISLCLYRAGESAALSWGEEYQGDYFYHDYYTGWVRRIARDADGLWKPVSPAPGQPDSLNWATGLTTCADGFIGTDGALYYLKQFDETFSAESGQVRRIVPKR